MAQFERFYIAFMQHLATYLLCRKFVLEIADWDFSIFD